MDSASNLSTIYELNSEKTYGDDEFSTGIDELLKEDDRLASTMDEDNSVLPTSVKCAKSPNDPKFDLTRLVSSESPSSLLTLLARQDVLRMIIYVIVFLLFTLPVFTPLYTTLFPVLFRRVETGTMTFTTFGVVAIACLASVVYSALVRRVM